ncbi:MAG: DNA polymerase Y family protein [Actinomycetota bacterium]
MASRKLVVVFPYWPLLAAGVDSDRPAVVVEANRVTVCSPAAEYQGIVPGMRRREAEGRCPSLVRVPPDLGRDAREFERVLEALETLTPAIEVLHPGTCLVLVDSSVRFFGSEQAVVGLAWAALAGHTGPTGPTGPPPTGPPPTGRTAFGLGVADGLFAAGLAALHSYRLHEPVVVAPDEMAGFLSPLQVSALGRPGLSDLLVRLGIKTLGDFAALPPADVAARFGPDGLAAYRLASGLDEHHFVPREHRPVLEVKEVFDPPTERIDVAIFAGKGLADMLAFRLEEEGLICRKLLIRASFDNGDELGRSWRLEGASTAGAIAERVRWQLEGWMSAGGGRSGELIALQLVPEQTSADQGRQLSFWGGPSEPGKRAVRGIARLYGLLDPEMVLVAELKGGRGPADRFRLVRADGVDLLGRSAQPPVGDAPWPGTLPSPSPALVFRDRTPARLVGVTDRPLSVVDQRLSEAAARLLVKGDRWMEVTGWAGPWPVNERWWDRSASKDLARLQVACSDGSAYLVAYEKGGWWLEARYD